MKIRSVTVAALTGALLATSVSPVLAEAPAQSAETLLIGHRGAGGVAPENTISAIKAGSRSGADFVEIDIQLSADGVPFIFHDDTPGRTTNVAQIFPGRAKDPITSFTWEELQRLDAGSYFSKQFVGEKIPHFDQVADALTGQTGVFIEIKSPGNSPGVEQVVADYLTSDPQWSALQAKNKIEVLGFDTASNKRFAALAPEVPLQQLSGSVPSVGELEEISSYADSFGTNYRTLDKQGAQAVKAAGLGLGVYTVNSAQAAQTALNMGVERLTGDFPEQLHRHLTGQKIFPSNNGVVIEEMINDVPGNDLQAESGEHVVLTNDSRRTIDVSGYLLRDAANNVLSIGAGYVLAPGACLRVYTGPGTNAADAYYNAGSVSVLNNGGDSVALWTNKNKLADTFAN